jgi:predicted metal-dependent phosphotriesterase family hydrolase
MESDDMPTTPRFISTVTGRVDPQTFDYIDAHDHLVAHAPAEVISEDPDLALDRPEHVEPDLRALQQDRQACVVEMTTVDYGRDVAALRELSRRTGVSIVSATGYNKGRYCRPFCEARDPDEIALIAIRDITEGVDSTGVRCGVVKFGSSANKIEPWEQVAGRAAGRAHRATGCPILTHTEAGTMAEEQLALLADERVSPTAVTIGHLDRNPDLELHRRLASTGAFLSYDQVPKPKYATEAPVIQLILALARDGLHQQVVVGGDFARRSLFTGYGGAPGLTYLPTVFAARLRQAADAAGLDGTNIVRDILQRNPQRALSFRATK